jgi:hypothetical protein
MATQGTYYLDAPSLGSATVIYSDAELTTVAPDGFYSDSTISREQVSGSLLPQVTCPSCATPCGGSISASGDQGIYYLNTDLGTATGAVVIKFFPSGIPDGILAVLNSISYNAVVSPTFGYLQGAAGLPTYLGSTGSDCGIVANSPYTLNEFEYDGTSFVSLGTTENISILSTQAQLTSSQPGDTVMVIPKTFASPSILALQIVGACSGTAFGISVACPVALPSFASSTVGIDSDAACADTVDQTYYVAYVNGATGVLGLYDLVFSDPNGEFKLGAGFYKTTAAGTDDWFQVDANGVIIAFGECAIDGTEYRLFGYAPDNAISDACAQTGTYQDLGTLTVYSDSSAPGSVTLFYNNYPPLANPYINTAIPNGSRVLYALASNITEKWTGIYSNTGGGISSNIPC